MKKSFKEYYESLNESKEVNESEKISWKDVNENLKKQLKVIGIKESNVNGVSESYENIFLNIKIASFTSEEINKLSKIKDFLTLTIINKNVNLIFKK